LFINEFNHSDESHDFVNFVNGVVIAVIVVVVVVVVLVVVDSDGGCGGGNNDAEDDGDVKINDICLTVRTFGLL